MSAAKPWLAEPDSMQFKYRGLGCFIVRMARLGHLCGYVRIDPEHPCFGMTYEQVHRFYDDEHLCHCGLTYAGERHPFTKDVQLDSWFLGFDAAHGGVDIIPMMAEETTGRETYKDMQFMQLECRQLADVLIDAQGT